MRKCRACSRLNGVKRKRKCIKLSKRYNEPCAHISFLHLNSRFNFSLHSHLLLFGLLKIKMKKQYMLSIVLATSIITARAQSSVTTIEYNKTMQPDLVLELPNTTNDVEGTILK